MYVVLGEDKIELKKLKGDILELIFRKNTFNRYTKEIPPLPYPKPNTVALNSAEKQITGAEYKDTGNGNYVLFLYLNNSNKERVELQLNKDNHMNGTSIELSKDDTSKQGWVWGVEYYDSKGNRIITTSGISLHFIQGTLSVSDTPGRDSVNILLKNGRVMGTDGMEYTLTLNYSGVMKDVTPDPKLNTVTLNSAEKQITGVEYIEQEDGNYTIFLQFNNSNNEKMKLLLNKDNHMKGNAIELSQPETTHKGWYWAVSYTNSYVNKIINASGDPSKHHFIQGTLTVSGIPGSGSVNILLKNGRVMGEDGKEYTLTLNYSGVMKDVTPGHKPNTVTLKSVEKKITGAEYINVGGEYLLLLYLNNSNNERVELHLNKDNHMKGNTIVLTQKDTSTKGWHWIVEYYDSSDSGIITAGGKDDPLQFKSGTLTISAPPESGKDITILLNNGKVIGTDGKTEYTLTLNYSGEMKEVE